MRTVVEELVYRSCLLLDDLDFEGFLSLCDADFRYILQAYAPEIRRDMVWLDHDRAGMQTLFRNLPRHHSDPSPLTRHATVYTVTFDEPNTRATVVSALQVFRTALDGGATSLFAVGKLHDTVNLAGGSALLARRAIRLDTRQLGIGSHIPL
ncbi:MAG: aromatic-ring-hydroxylating dioxygenase subunit beta [Polyangiaceae bacterium]